MDATRPTREIKTAWKSAKLAAKVRCRFHDLRHTACTRLLERGTPLPVVAAIFGWSAGTTAKMAKRYGHIGTNARRIAVASLDGSSIDGSITETASDESAAVAVNS
jgi:integrase